MITFRIWRIVHRSATSVLAILAILHSTLTFVLYDQWTPDAVWFLGTGLGLLFLAVSNWSHVGLEPCSQPTAPVVRWANFIFVLLGIAAVIAVPEPQAYLVLAALVVQAIAGTRTLSPSA
ncbi:MAG TPA: hypothetical protein VGD27_10270 [Longimicrobiales bacterium]